MSEPTPPLVPVILSGGSGTRLWPMSRQSYPKQFIPLLGSHSLFQETVRRIQGIQRIGPLIVVCNQEHRFMAAEQLSELGMGDAALMLEPTGRNTAPAIAVAALEARARHGDAVLLVLPADHLIRDVETFRAAVADGYRAALHDWLVTFGIVPDRAETGYGYIRQGESLVLEGREGPALRIESFVEKPDQDTAQGYLRDGRYLWNSGMFLFKAARYLEELGAHAPEIVACAEQAYGRRSQDLGFVRLDREAFERSPSESIDYAVMERTARAAVIPLQAGWSDVGSWHSLWEAEPHDGSGNIQVGDVIAEDSRGCYLHANHRLLGVVGLKDLVVVETADAVLVAPRTRSQEVRRIVERLNAGRRPEAVTHRKVYRPWGAYERIDRAERFQVNRITVEPGHSLSLQLHHHRAEHWIVVKGTARVSRGDEVYMLAENESTFIPIGVRHRLENPGKIPLEIIEVQSGSYLDEDDIVRLEDNYGRDT